MKHDASLVDLNYMMDGMSLDEKRVFLQKFYSGAYYNNMYEPHNTLHSWQWVIERTGVPFTKALDVGCGTGEGIRWALDHGKDVYGIDFADAREAWKQYNVEDRCQIAHAQNIPYPDDTFDLVCCFDVLEHIPEEDIPLVLKEIRRVGNLAYILAICLVVEAHPVGNRVISHITIKDIDWWIQKMHEAGFGAALFKDGTRALQFDDHHIRAFLTKEY